MARSADRTDLVSVELPSPAFGIDAVFEPVFNIRPMPDQACPGNVAGIVADVWVEALHGERKLSPDEGQAILQRIKDEKPWAVWDEIEAKAAANHLGEILRTADRNPTLGDKLEAA